MADTNSNTDEIEEKTLTNQWLFNEIMRHIEPELLQSNEELELKYTQETEADMTERLERYQQAFTRYHEVANQLKKGLEMDILTKRKERRLTSIAEDSKQAEEVLNNLSDKIDNA